MTAYKQTYASNSWGWSNCGCHHAKSIIACPKPLKVQLCIQPEIPCKDRGTTYRSTRHAPQRAAAVCPAACTGESLADEWWSQQPCHLKPAVAELSASAWRWYCPVQKWAHLHEHIASANAVIKLRTQDHTEGLQAFGSERHAWKCNILTGSYRMSYLWLKNKWVAESAEKRIIGVAIAPILMYLVMPL